MNLTFGLCAGASPLSSRYPADKYMNVLGICSAITAKSSEALADIPGYPVSPGIPISSMYPTISSVRAGLQISGGTSESISTSALPP